MEKDKSLILTCDGVCDGHHIIFRQIYNPHETDPALNNEVYITVHLDKIPFWQRVRWVLTGKNEKYGHFVSTITTKEKLENIVKQLD